MEAPMMSADNNNSPEPPSEPDTGLLAFVLIARFHGMAADPEQLKHLLGGTKAGILEILRCAKQLQLKARIIESDWDRLSKTPMPSIACLQDGKFVVIGRVTETTVLVQTPGTDRPQLMQRDEFQAAWNGSLILVTRRAGLGDLAQNFQYHMVFTGHA